MVVHRKLLKKQAKEAEEPKDRRRLEALAKRLWKHRGVLFKRDQRMTPQERRELWEPMAIDEEVSVLRGFLNEVWGIFRDSKGQLGARQCLGKLRRRTEVQPNTAYAKAVNFLVKRFDDMVTFLGSAGIQRNSLAETGIRCLRRLEQSHEGFRGSAGRDNDLRPYQAVRYCGWSVHRGDGLRFLPPQQTTPSASAA